MAKKFLKMYPNYSKMAFDDIVTGDETWVYVMSLFSSFSSELAFYIVINLSIESMGLV